MATEKKYLSLDKLQKYDAKIKALMDTKDAAKLQEAKNYSDSLAENYEKAGAVATAQTALQKNIDTVSGVANQNAEAIAAINNAETGLLKQAKDYADTEVGKVNTALGNLDSKVGVLPTDGGYTSVVDMVEKKTANIASDDTVGAIDDRLGVVEGKVGTLQTLVGETSVGSQIDAKITALDLANTYEEKGAAADVQTALEEKIGTVTEGKTVVGMIADAQAAATYDDTEVRGLISDNKEAIDLLNDGASVEGSVDYKIAQAVAAIMENPDETMNSIQELVNWTQTHAQDALALSNTVAGHTTQIGALETKVGTETVAKQISDAITAALQVEGVDKYALASELTAAVARIAANETAIGNKVEKSVYDGKVAELVAADETLSGRIDDLESAIGESGSVADDIATAKQEAVEEAAATAQTKADAALASAKEHTNTEVAKVQAEVDALETVVEGKAAQSDLTALAGRVTTAEGEIDTLQTDLDTVEALAAANKAAHEANAAALKLKANQSDLDALTTRVAANEAEIASFVEISDSEINQLFSA